MTIPYGPLSVGGVYMQNDSFSVHKSSFLLFSTGVNKPAKTTTSHLIETTTRKTSMELRNETQAATANEGMSLATARESMT